MHLRPTLALAFFATPVCADLLIVEPGGLHSTLQSAVDAASDGDSILVTAANFGVTTIAGKSLHIFGDSQLSNTESFVVVVVRDLAPAQSVTLRGFRFEASSARTLHIEDCAGPVWIEDYAGDITVAVSNSPSVALIRCAVEGAVPTSPFTPSIVGVHASQSSGVLAYNTHATGNSGCDGKPEPFLNCDCEGSPASPGFSVAGGSFLFATGCTFMAGPPGTSFSGDFGGDYYSCPGGPGATSPGVVTANSELIAVDCDLLGPNPVVGPWTSFPGPARSFEISPGVATAGSSVDLSFTSAPGDVALSLSALAPSPTFDYFDGPLGASLVPLASPIVVWGPLATNTLVVTLDIPALPPGLPALPLYTQAAYLTPFGHLRAGAGSATLLLGQ